MRRQKRKIRNLSPVRDGGEKRRLGKKGVEGGVPLRKGGRTAWNAAESRRKRTERQVLITISGKRESGLSRELIYYFLSEGRE